MIFPFRPILHPSCHCEPVRRLVWQSVPPMSLRGPKGRGALSEARKCPWGAISRYHPSTRTAKPNLAPGDSHVAPLLGMTGKWNIFRLPCHCEAQRAAAISRYHPSTRTAKPNLVPGDSPVAPLLGMTGKTQHPPITLSLRGPKGRGNLPVPLIDLHRRPQYRTRRFIQCIITYIS